MLAMSMSQWIVKSRLAISGKLLKWNSQWQFINTTHLLMKLVSQIKFWIQIMFYANVYNGGKLFFFPYNRYCPSQWLYFISISQKKIILIMNYWKDHRYCLQNFREDVVWSLAELEEYDIPKLDQWKPPSIEPSFYETAYTKIFNSKKKLKSLLQRHKTRTKKIESYCSASQCSVYLH